MKAILGRRPSPSLVISVLALIVAVGGGTLALAASDNKKDKKIATGVVTGLASGLSVGHAKTADSAGVADVRFLRGTQASCTASTLCSGESPVCPAGEVATGGGVETNGHRGANIIESTFNYGTFTNPPAAHRQWFGQIDNVSGTSANWEVDVICAPTSNLLTARGHSQTDAQTKR